MIDLDYTLFKKWGTRRGFSQSLPVELLTKHFGYAKELDEDRARCRLRKSLKLRQEDFMVIKTVKSEREKWK